MGPLEVDDDVAKVNVRTPRSASVTALMPTLTARYPGLQVAYAESPPYRTSTPDEDTATMVAILASEAWILFVGLGCPKQMCWMAEHRDRLPLVALGVGAAFDFHAGRVRQTPPALQRLGLEWAFRMAMETRWLAKRFLKHPPRFVWHFERQLVRERRNTVAVHEPPSDTSP